MLLGSRGRTPRQVTEIGVLHLPEDRNEKTVNQTPSVYYNLNLMPDGVTAAATPIIALKAIYAGLNLTTAKAVGAAPSASYCIGSTVGGMAWSKQAPAPPSRTSSVRKRRLDRSREEGAGDRALLFISAVLFISAPPHPEES